MTAKLVRNLVQVQETVNVSVAKAVPVTVTTIEDGKEITVTRQEIVFETIQQQTVRNYSLKGLKASDGKGEIAEDDLKKKLEDGASVVISNGPLEKAWKKMFAEDVIFLETAGRMGGVRPGVRPLPAPINPGAGGPAILPIAPPKLVEAPIEKKDK